MFNVALFSGIGLFLLAAVVAASVTIRGDRRADPTIPRTHFLYSIAILFTVALAGAIWEHRALAYFAKEAGPRGLQGMIAHPLPNYIDYEFTTKGRHYQYWAIELPVSVTIAALTLAALLASVIMHRRGFRSFVVGVWAYAVVWCGLFLLFTLYKYLIATDFFI